MALALRSASLPLFERIEDHEHRAQVRAVGPQDERNAGNDDGVGNPLGRRTISSTWAMASSVRCNEAESGSCTATNR